MKEENGRKANLTVRMVPYPKKGEKLLFSMKMLTFVMVLLNAISCSAGNKTAGSTSPKQSPRKIEMKCGEYTVAITCRKQIDPSNPQDERQCNHNTLTFTGPEGKMFIPSTPKGFDESKTPVSMSCGQSKKNGRFYVTIEFSNGPTDCVPCMTYHLFESNGNRLTADKTDAMRQYDKAIKNLRIPITRQINIEGD